MSFEMNRSLHDDCRLAFCWRSACCEGHLIEKEIGPFSHWPISFPSLSGLLQLYLGDIFPELLWVTESLNSNSSQKIQKITEKSSKSITKTQRECSAGGVNSLRSRLCSLRVRMAGTKSTVHSEPTVVGTRSESN